MSNKERPTVNVLWSLQVMAFLLLLFFASGFYLSFPAYLLIILTEVGVIYGLMKARKDLFLYFWQLQFFLVIVLCMVERTDLFFNTQDVPVELVWMGLILILLLEIIFTLLLIYKERVIKKVLSGVTVVTVCIVLILIGTICYEGIQIFGDVEPESFVLSSDWRPTPSVPEFDELAMKVTDEGLGILISQSTTNCLLGEEVQVNYSVFNHSPNLDTIIITWTAPTSILFVDGTNNSELTIGPENTTENSLLFIPQAEGNWTITVTLL
jgi:hypothetical protein